MSLPKISYPVFELEIPSSGKIINFRPFLSKEEKILLFAKESQEKKEIIKAIKQVVNNCAVDSFDINELSTVDLEYIYLKLRARSINNIVNVSFRDVEDDKIYDFEIDLNKLEVKKNKENNNVIKVTDEIGIILKAPDAKIDDVIANITTPNELYDQVLKYCVEKIYDNDNVWVKGDFTDEELNEFLDKLPHTTFKQIQNFFDTLPTLSYEIQYKNSLGHDRKIIMNTLIDFFI